MNNRALLSVCACGAIGLFAPAARAAIEPDAVALIETTYPAAHDVRRPDRTVADMAGGPAAVSAYSLDGRVLATAGRDARDGKVQVRLWNARTGEEGTGEALLRTLEAPGPAPIVGLGFHATDKGVVVVAVAGKVANRWDSATGQLLGSATFKGALGNVAFAPGAPAPPAASPAAAGAAQPANAPVAPLAPVTASIVAGTVGNQVALWNFESGAELKTLGPQDARVRCLGFQPDGRILVAGTEKGTVRFWNVDSGALVRTLETGAGLRSCAVSATHMVVGGADGGVKLWTIGGDDPVDDVHREAPHRHKGPVDLVALSAKGSEWASAGPDGIIEIRDVATGRQLAVLQGHKGTVTTVAFNPNGQKLASTGADKTLRTWTVPLPPLPPGDLAKITAALPAKASAVPKRPRKLLVFWRADAILHKGGVPAANKAIELLGQKTGAFTAHFSRDTDVFTPELLARYDAIVFNSTAHIVLDDPAKKKALLDYVRGGGGVIGIHAAIDMFRTWPEGAQVIGATFAGHPWHPSGTWSVKLDEPNHVLMRAWAKKNFKMHDEFYELGEPYTRKDRLVLMSLDNSDPATTAATPLHRPDKDFAVSWIKRYGQGKVFYCMFGHLGDPFQIPAVLQFYLDGIQYALGDLEADATPKPKTTASRPSAGARL